MKPSMQNSNILSSTNNIIMIFLLSSIPPKGFLLPSPFSWIVKLDWQFTKLLDTRGSILITQLCRGASFLRWAANIFLHVRRQYLAAISIFWHSLISLPNQPINVCDCTGKNNLQLYLQLTLLPLFQIIVYFTFILKIHLILTKFIKNIDGEIF